MHSRKKWAKKNKEKGDAEGAYVGPGLVDIHSHPATGVRADLIFVDSKMNAKTVILGGKVVREN